MNSEIHSDISVARLSAARSCSSSLRAASGLIILESGTIIYASDDAAAAFGGHAEDLVGRAIAEFLPVPERQRLEDWSILVSRQPWLLSAWSTVLLTANGQSVPFDIVAFPFSQPDVLALRLSANSRPPLPAAPWFADDFGPLTAQLDERMLAHDLNNVVNVVRESTRTLLEESLEADEWRQIATEILQASERAAVIARRLTSLHQSMADELIDLQAVIDNMRGMLQQAVGKHIQLVFAAPTKLYVQIVASDLERILLNLVINAAEAVQGAGTIRVETDKVELLQRDGSTTRLYAIINVIDSGQGLHTEVKCHVFDPFFTTKDQKREARGLGLATVHNLVKQRGGFIFVNNEQQGGARFQVLLPAAEPTD